MTEPTNLVELAEASTAKFAARPLFGERRGDVWEWTTYAEWQRKVDDVRAGLAALGVGPGDRVAIVSRNSTAWATAAYATYGLGAAFVPMYEAQRAEDWEFILRDCGAVVVFARTHDLAAKLRAMQPGLPALAHVITIEGDVRDHTSLEALAGRGHGAPRAALHAASGDLAGLVYTSGTTGKPKGVMLSHGNLVSNVLAVLSGFPLSETDRTVSFLPWAHVYGQVVELHILVAAGGSTAFNTNTEHLLEDLRDVRPTILVAVPRVFNKLHAAVRTQIAARPRIVQSLFSHGLAASIRRRRGERLTLRERVILWFAGILFAAVRRKLGGRLRYAVTGSASLSRDVAEFIDGLGIEVYEGYGLTETSPVVAMNRPGRRKFGTVGQILDGVRVVIDETSGSAAGEGEIVVYGPNVMQGYYARPEENARAFTADGGLRSGDLGRLDADGYLSITGRLKEQYKLENGKYVMPSPLEEQLALSPYIQSVMLYGAGKPYNVALVVIDAARVRADHIPDDRVHAVIMAELARCAEPFRAFERPRECAIIDTPFTIENGLLTPTLKLKRKEVVARYGAMLEALYLPATALATAALRSSTGAELHT